MLLSLDLPSETLYSHTFVYTLHSIRIRTDVSEKTWLPRYVVIELEQEVVCSWANLASLGSGVGHGVLM